MLKKNITKDIIKFLLVVLVTIMVTYSAPKILASLWYVATLIMYYRSRDEAFWLAFYFVTVDGFFGYLGIYTVTIPALPGLPAIELVQFYILVSFIKAIQIKREPYIFYNRYITILLFYLVFLIVWGQMMGFSGEFKDYFRVIKLTLPFILFYTLPRLLANYESYKRLFAFIFVVLIGAFLTQLFVLLTGILPTRFVELTAEQVSEAGEFRGFYNISITLIGLFGALFFMTQEKEITFSRIYLYILIISAFGIAYISATRGWILSFSFIILSSFLLIPGIGPKKTAGFLAISVVVVLLGLSNDKIRRQIDFAADRIETIRSLAEGDITAGGTLKRLSIRGPRVIKVFRENPVFGWGFSDMSRKYGDIHVANQNLLMHSGIIGFCLLIGFLGYFSVKMLLSYFNKKRSGLFKKSFLLFVIFLAGWFILHSTSAQMFNYMNIPVQIIPQAIFFSFGAFVYSNNIKDSGKEI